MAQKIILKKSAVADKVPLASDLSYGELALNYADGVLYFKDSSNNIQSVGGGGGAQVWTGDAPPSSAITYPLWWDTETGTLKIYYADGTSNQWVDATPGIIGPQGDSGTLEIGPTTTVNPSASPSVINSGTATDAVFEFSLPRAAAVSVGTVTTGAAGSSVAITNTGTNGDVVLNFTIPKGDTGTASVLGPASSTNNNIAAFDGTTGQLLKDGGIATSAIATLTGSQTLTNKTISGANNTISNINLASQITGTLPIANGGTGATTAANALTALGGVPLAGGVSMTGSLYTRGAFGMKSSSIAGNPILYDVTDQAGNTVLEIGRTDGTSSTVAIDIHTGASAIDYDTRLQFTGGNGTNGNGTLNIAASTLQWNGVSLATISTTQTLTNKTISGGSNTITNIGNSSLTNASVTVNGSAVSLGSSTTITAVNPSALTIGTGLSGTSYDGSGAVTITIDSTVATLTSSQTLTNKTISGASNTLSNIPLTAITSWPSGVDATEVGYLDGVSSSIQTQIDNKASTGKAIAMAIVFG